MRIERQRAISALQLGLSKRLRQRMPLKFDGVGEARLMLSIVDSAFSTAHEKSKGEYTLNALDAQSFCHSAQKMSPYLDLIEVSAEETAKDFKEAFVAIVALKNCPHKNPPCLNLGVAHA